jgi:hypothetical protein
MGLNRSSDETALVNTVKALQTNLADALATVNKWAIEVDVRLETVPSFAISVNVKRGAVVYYKLIPLADVQYYAEDPETLISEIAESVYHSLLKNNIRDELRPLITKALINCNKMATR